jgi:hypothetical protein
MKRALLFLALGGVCLSASACGGAVALDPVANAATKTAKLDTAHFHMDLSTKAGAVGPLQFAADGVVDNATHTLQMTTDLSSIAQLAGSKAGSPDQWKANLILDGGNGGPVLYVSLPAMDQFLPPGKTWLKADLQKLGEQAGVNLSQLLQSVGSQDPTQALQMLESVADVQKVGTAQVGGVDTTEYSATIDPQKVIAKFPGSGLEKYSKLLGTQKIPVQVWIGGDGLVRKVHESFTAKAASIDMTIELSDFGAPVTVTVPPADQVADISDLKGH